MTSANKGDERAAIEDLCSQAVRGSEIVKPVVHLDEVGDTFRLSQCSRQCTRRTTALSGCARTSG